MVSHTFKTPGKYTISVTVNGSCSEYSTLVVVKPVLKISPVAVPVFAGPETVSLGEPVSFEDTSSLGRSWEWQFEAGGPVEAKGKQATYTFITPGRHLVTVTLNGRVDMFASRFIEVLDDTPEIEKVAKTRETGSRRPKVIEVPSDPSVAPITSIPIPPQADPEPEPVKKAPMIAAPELEKKLEEVAKGRLSAQAFSDYLCGNLDRQVTYNGEVTTFSQMCIQLEKTRDRRVRKISVVIFRDETSQCIQSLQVTLKKDKNLI